ncbi:hypothetical protein LWI28_000307 [Acer negundo]|uniref:Uncharacterized protein n=1 Tax=Acer negundo TaxID=4023 RepID=A0AAD5NVD0_ACENE|nr:hypothetical protein LWI28_000307 [Acer negundo]
MKKLTLLRAKKQEKVVDLPCATKLHESGVSKTESSICEEMKERKERDRRLRLWEKNQVRLWRYAPDIQGNPRFSTHLSQEYWRI